MSVQDSYVDRRGKGQVFGVAGESSILRALSSKNNAVRRLERQGRRSKNGMTKPGKSTWAA